MAQGRDELRSPCEEAEIAPEQKRLPEEAVLRCPALAHPLQSAVTAVSPPLDHALKKASLHPLHLCVFGRAQSKWL